MKQTTKKEGAVKLTLESPDETVYEMYFEPDNFVTEMENLGLVDAGSFDNPTLKYDTGHRRITMEGILKSKPTTQPRTLNKKVLVI